MITSHLNRILVVAELLGLVTPVTWLAIAGLYLITLQAGSSGTSDQASEAFSTVLAVSIFIGAVGLLALWVACLVALFGGITRVPRFVWAVLFANVALVLVALSLLGVWLLGWKGFPWSTGLFPFGMLGIPILIPVMHLVAWKVLADRASGSSWAMLVSWRPGPGDRQTR